MRNGYAHYGEQAEHLLGEAYECQTFICKCGFEIERDTDRAFARMTAKATHKSEAFTPNKTRRRAAGPELLRKIFSKSVQFRTVFKPPAWDGSELRVEGFFVSR